MRITLNNKTYKFNICFINLAHPTWGARLYRHVKLKNILINDYVYKLTLLGFNQKVAAKCLLEKQFTTDIDYKIIALEYSKAK